MSHFYWISWKKPSILTLGSFKNGSANINQTFKDNQCCEILLYYDKHFNLFCTLMNTNVSILSSFFPSNMSVFFLGTFHFFPQKYHFQYWTMFNFRVSSENFCQFFEKHLFEREIEFAVKKKFLLTERCVSFSRCRNGYENQFHKSDYFLFL
jgi:hypothetical protein